MVAVSNKWLIQNRSNNSVRCGRNSSKVNCVVLNQCFTTIKQLYTLKRDINIIVCPSPLWHDKEASSLGRILPLMQGWKKTTRRQRGCSPAVIIMGTWAGVIWSVHFIILCCWRERGIGSLFYWVITMSISVMWRVFNYYRVRFYTHFVMGTLINLVGLKHFFK